MPDLTSETSWNDTFTLRDAATTLGVQYRTFAYWLKESHIQPVPDRVDRRKRVITIDQLNEIARVHRRNAVTGVSKLSIDMLQGRLNTIDYQLEKLGGDFRSLNARLAPLERGQKRLRTMLNSRQDMPNSQDGVDAIADTLAKALADAFRLAMPELLKVAAAAQGVDVSGSGSAKRKRRVGTDEQPSSVDAGSMPDFVSRQPVPSGPLVPVERITGPFAEAIVEAFAKVVGTATDSDEELAIAAAESAEEDAVR